MACLQCMGACSIHPKPRGWAALEPIVLRVRYRDDGWPEVYDDASGRVVSGVRSVDTSASVGGVVSANLNVLLKQPGWPKRAEAPCKINGPAN